MIHFIPLGDRETASSRLRVHLIAPHLGASVGIPKQYSKGDTLIIQKTPEIGELEKAHESGAKVIYDIDDYLWHLGTYKRMILEADLVTVDSQAKAENIELVTGVKAVVIPDALDWDGTVANDTEKKVIGWTGHGNNAEYLNPIGGELSKRFTWRMITSDDVGKFINFPFSFKKWSLETVDKDLAKCEFSVYYLPDDIVGNLKGMHKLLKSWAVGIPCYTSRMPDYVKAMKEAGVGEKYLVDEWSKLENIGFDEKCREYALTFKSELISELWKQAIGVVQKESGD